VALYLWSHIPGDNNSQGYKGVIMFDTTRGLRTKDLMNNAKLAEALIAVINELQEMTKEVQKLRVDVDKLIENNK
jgi:hypothetical protein